MLPSLSRPLVRLFIGERIVAAECKRRWGKSHLHDIRFSDLPENDDGIESAIDAVLSNRPESGVVEVILGQPHVFYLALPWEHSYHKHDVLVEQARQKVASLFGDRVGQVSLCVDKAIFGRPSIAAAVSAGIIEATNRVAKKNGYKLRSMQPLVSYLWNILKRNIAMDVEAFEIVEDGFLTRAKIERRAVADVSVSPLLAAEPNGDAGKSKPFFSVNSLQRNSVLKRTENGEVAILVSNDASRGISNLLSFILSSGGR